MLKTANNAEVVKALKAVGVAYASMPDFDLSRSMELAARMERAIGDERQMHVIVALTALLLSGIDAGDAGTLRWVSRR